MNTNKYARAEAPFPLSLEGARVTINFPLISCHRGSLQPQSDNGAFWATVKAKKTAKPCSRGKATLTMFMMDNIVLD